MSQNGLEKNTLLTVEQSVAGNKNQVAGRDIHNHFVSGLPISIDCSPEELAEVERMARNLIADARRRLLLSKANGVMIVGLLGIVAYCFAGLSVMPDNLRWLEWLIFYAYLITMLGVPSYFIIENRKKEGMFITIGKARLTEVETILRYQAAAKRPD
ncbi:MAG: hypothetical protein BVN35_20315 [Proteobacteria bacterium ST_bin11]|nr:MAG: hypothetical protein BVN35_20315 [Proteobacteria bacterium ST_bin11]